jgi:hypothetical protein
MSITTSVWEDDQENRKMRHTIRRLRPFGTYCCVPDEHEESFGNFRMCDREVCGTRGRSSEVGCCLKPQRAGGRSCYAILKDFLDEGERQEYEIGVRTMGDEALRALQRKVSVKLFGRMLYRRTDCDTEYPASLMFTKQHEIKQLYMEVMYQVLKPDAQRRAREGHGSS